LTHPVKQSRFRPPSSQSCRASPSPPPLDSAQSEAVEAALEKIGPATPEVAEGSADAIPAGGINDKIRT
jgi:hypothetical protein